FNEIFPRFSYENYVGVFSLIGLLVSILGLNIILDLAIPLLVFIYPISIVLIMLSLFQHITGGGKMMYRLSVAITSIYALYEVAANIGLDIVILKKILSMAPFFEEGLGWTFPALIAAVIGYALDKTITDQPVGDDIS